MKRIAFLLAVILMLSVILIGCRRGESEEFLAYVISDWEVLSHYSGNEDGKYVGTYDKDGDVYVFTWLEGMDKNMYLNVKTSSFMGGLSTHEIYMNKLAPLPVMVCDAKRIDVKWNNVPQTIDDEKAVSDLLDIIRSGEGIKTERQLLSNTKIVFDLPCDLTLTCHLKKKADGTFYLIYFDQRSGDYLSYDVTEVFKDKLR